MTWVYITLAILLSLGVLAHSLKFQLAVAYHSPAVFTLKAGVSFLGFHREFVLPSPPGPKSISHQEFTSGQREFTSGQSGFVRVPESWLTRIQSLRKHGRLALLKFVLDPKVWGVLFTYLVRSGRRTFRLLHIALKSIHVGMEDPVSLGKFAAVWSSLSVLFLPLACPIEYAFNERPGSVKLSLTGGFTGLEAMAFACALFFTFPWLRLGHRFLSSWRNPRLNRWQRRLLLF